MAMKNHQSKNILKIEKNIYTYINNNFLTKGKNKQHRHKNKVKIVLDLENSFFSAQGKGNEISTEVTCK